MTHVVAQGQSFILSGNSQDAIQELSSQGITNLTTNGVHSPWGIATDPEEQKIYWSNVTEGSIRRVNRDGTQAETVLTGRDVPRGLALDVEDNTLFWAEGGGVAPGIRSLDLSTVNAPVVDVVTAGVSSPYHITLDPTNNYIYWVDNALGAKHIKRASYDGNTVETVVSTIRQVAGITLDLENNKLFWSDFEEDKIYSASTLGVDQNIQTVYTFSGSASPWALHYDAHTHRLIGSDYLNQTVLSIDPDTGQKNSLATNTANIAGINTMASSTASTQNLVTITGVVTLTPQNSIVFPNEFQLGDQFYYEIDFDLGANAGSINNFGGASYTGAVKRALIRPHLTNSNNWLNSEIQLTASNVALNANGEGITIQLGNSVVPNLGGSPFFDFIVAFDYSGVYDFDLTGHGPNYTFLDVTDPNFAFFKAADVYIEVRNNQFTTQNLNHNFYFYAGSGTADAPYEIEN